VPPGYALHISNAFRRAVDLPVVGVGRIKSPEQAERALAEGHCDLVGVVRGQIADPDLVAKARSGRSTEIRACLSCNQECVGRVGLNRWLGCVENPAAGRESAPQPLPLTRPRRVLVVGGGPAGLRAAASAAHRGHRVTLLERAPATGGQIAVAATVPARAELLDLVRNLLAECRRHGVEVRTGTDVTARDLHDAAPDAVVLATGARPKRPHWAGALERVVDVRDVLEGRAAPEGEVLVWDELGFHQATSVAETLADRGCRVRLATSALTAAQGLGTTLDQEHWTVRAHAKGITEATGVVVMAAEDHEKGIEVDLLAYTTGTTTRQRYDWVVCAVHQDPEDTLWQQLRDAPFEVHRIGDCLTPRRADAAVVEGHRIGSAL
jgi:hypothetical protein